MELKPREKKSSIYLQTSFTEAEHKHIKNMKEKNLFINSQANRQLIPHCSLNPREVFIFKGQQTWDLGYRIP